MFNIINDTYPEDGHTSKLGKAIKAINDTMRPELLVLSILVFGVLPSFPVPTSSKKTEFERFKALKLARTKME